MKQFRLIITSSIIVATFAILTGCVRQDHCFAERAPKHISGENNSYISFADLAYMAANGQLTDGDTACFFARMEQVSVVCVLCAHTENVADEFRYFLDYGEDSKFGDSVYMIEFSTEGTYYNSNGQGPIDGGERMRYCYIAKTAYTDSIISNRTSDSVYVTAILGTGICVARKFPHLQSFVYDNSKIIFKDEELQSY